jgi:DNA-binding PadR family transcriptional regulator
MPLEHAILAFLELRPMTGYDLKLYLDQSVAHFWSATQSHIYKALDGLEKQGWAEVTWIAQEGKPNRKEFRITDAGRAELRRWLTTPLPLEAVRLAWLIQVFFSHPITNEEIVSLLEARMEAIRARLKTYREAAQTAIDENARQFGIERAQALWQITLDYGIDRYKSELVWLEKILERVRNLPPLIAPAKPK